MTVPGTDTAPEAVVDRAAAEQRLEEIHRKYWRMVVHFIWTRVDQRHVSFAEDLASETFILLWTKYLSAGKDVAGHPIGLLCTLARHRIADFYKVRRNQFLAVDFSDSANNYLERGHSYAHTQPEAALLAKELDQAMENMTDLSRKWRDSHTLAYRMRNLLNDSDSALTYEDSRPAVQAKYDSAVDQSDRLLKAFRQACARVGELRQGLEAAGGPNWCSSTGMPATTNRSYAKEDTSQRTHCSKGHELTLENTHFSERGNKKCRTCTKDRLAAQVPQRPAGPRQSTVPAEVIERARELLKNPALSVRKVAAMVGVPRTTLLDRIPDMDQLRSTATAPNLKTSPEVIERARALLTDPERQRSIASVAKEVGVSGPTLYARIPDLTELRRQAYGQRRTLAGAAR